MTNNKNEENIIKVKLMSDFNVLEYLYIRSRSENGFHPHEKEIFFKPLHLTYSGMENPCSITTSIYKSHENELTLIHLFVDALEEVADDLFVRDKYGILRRSHPSQTVYYLRPSKNYNWPPVDEFIEKLILEKNNAKSKL